MFKKTHAKMLNISNYKTHAIKTTTRYHLAQSERPSSKSLQTINAGEGVEKRELSYTVGGNVNLYSHYGEQYGGSLKYQKYSYHMIQQSHSKTYIQRKP